MKIGTVQDLQELPLRVLLHMFSSQARRRERHMFLFCFIWPVRLVVVEAFKYLVLSWGVSISFGLASCGVPLDFTLLGTEGS